MFVLSIRQNGGFHYLHYFIILKNSSPYALFGIILPTKHQKSFRNVSSKNIKLVRINSLGFALPRQSSATTWYELSKGQKIDCSKSTSHNECHTQNSNEGNILISSVKIAPNKCNKMAQICTCSKLERCWRTLYISHQIPCHMCIVCNSKNATFRLVFLAWLWFLHVFIVSMSHFHLDEMGKNTGSFSCVHEIVVKWNYFWINTFKFLMIFADCT